MASFAHGALRAHLGVRHQDDLPLEPPSIPSPALWGWIGAMIGFGCGALMALPAELPLQTAAFLGALALGAFAAWLAHGVASARLASHHARVSPLDRAVAHVPVAAMAARMARLALPTLQAMIAKDPRLFEQASGWTCTMDWSPSRGRVEPRFRYEEAVFQMRRVPRPDIKPVQMSFHMGGGAPMVRAPIALPSLHGTAAQDWQAFCDAQPVLTLSLEGLQVGTSKHMILALIAEMTAFAEAAEAAASQDTPSALPPTPARPTQVDATLPRDALPLLAGRA